MDGREVFARNLKALMRQLGLSNVQIARAVGVDPSLVSRWLRAGCSPRNADVYALAIARYVRERNTIPENVAWMRSQLRDSALPDSAPEVARIALWLCPQADVSALTRRDSEFASLLVVDGFREAVLRGSEGALPPAPCLEQAPRFLAGAGTEEVVRALEAELQGLPEGARADVYLSSETAPFTDPRIICALERAARTRGMRFRMLVNSANNSVASSHLVSSYMALLVQGKLELSVVQGTPQTFATTIFLVFPGRSVLTVAQAAQKDSRPVCTVARDAAIVKDMAENFEKSLRYARPMMVAYDDSYARNIIEIFFQEYGVTGDMDVIKSGLNPLFMTEAGYGRVLKGFGHAPEQYAWRMREFSRFKASMEPVLAESRFREVLSLSKLREVAATGRCRMPAMYFMDGGIRYLDRTDCVNALEGYIRYMERFADLQVLLLEDDGLFMENSCWHIKGNRHVLIHSWDVERPLMVYSDQMMLIDEFQNHFNTLWEKVNGGVYGKRAAISTLRALRDQLVGQTQRA